MKQMFKLLFVGIMVGITIIFSGCGGSGNEGANAVGNNLVSSEVMDDIDASTILGMVKASGIDANATNAFAYKAVKITYKTTNIKGDSINASGLLVIPTPTDAYKAYLASLGKSFSLSAVCDNHGTIFLDSEAPTSVEKTQHYYPDALLLSGYAGFASIFPDYVGFGDSKGEVHPYVMKQSAQASLDMIRASVKYMTDNHVLFNGQLYLTGYSEGGYVTMALAKDIEENHSSEFQLMGVAPMAGPYDVEGLAAFDLNANMKMVYPAFLAEIASSYSKAYDDINISDLVVKPDIFNSIDLFGGDYDTVPIHVALGLADVTIGDYGFNTHYANELFKDSFINDYQGNLNNSARVRFAQNGVYDWTPKSKMNIIGCVDDEIIPFTLSAQKAYDTFIANGAKNVTLSPIPSSYIPVATPTKPFVHQRCGSVAYGMATKWFSDIRSGAIK